MWHEMTSPLDQSSPNRIGWGKGREKLEREKEGERKEGILEIDSNFSLNFLAIGPSVFGKARSKVSPHGKGYAWVPVLWSFDNSGR